MPGTEIYCPCCKQDRTGLFIRVNPLGEMGIFWCSTCVAKKEPELYKNEMEDGLLKDLGDAIKSIK